MQSGTPPASHLQELLALKHRPWQHKLAWGHGIANRFVNPTTADGRRDLAHP